MERTLTASAPGIGAALEIPAIQPELRSKFTALYGAAGHEWIERFPNLLRSCIERWAVVEVGEPFGYVGYAWVAPVRVEGGSEAVLKLAPPDQEFANEYHAMRLYGGNGAARLIDGDPAAVALLLERLRPGTTLADLGDDAEATGIGARAMADVFRPLPAEHTFPTLAQWGAAFERVRARHGGGCGGFPVDLFEPAQRIYFELCASQEAPVLLHGDLHHWNILRAERAQWLAIDPKGLAGERAFEPAAFLRNKADIAADATALARRRIAQMSGVLGVDAQRVLLWAFAGGVLGALWEFEDDGKVHEEHLVIARALRPLV